MRIRIKLLFKAVLTIFLITSLTSEPQSFAADDHQSTTVPLNTDVKGLKALEEVIVSFKDDLSEVNWPRSPEPVSARWWGTTPR